MAQRTQGLAQSARPSPWVTRLVRWCVYNLLFALLPLGIVTLILYLYGNLTLQEMANSSEILFFTLMVNATALGDLNESDIAGHRTLSLLFKSVLLLGAMFSAILYGVLTLNLLSEKIFVSAPGTSNNPAELQFRLGLLG
nr:hypothetical protein [Candidatus Tectomicrobia bacterium]